MKFGDHPGKRRAAITELAQWRLDYKNAKEELKTDDPLLAKLSDYHKHLSCMIDNIVTEKLAPEVEELLIDPSKVDDFSRPISFSKEDETRLNALNVQAKDLKTPAEWTWAAKEGTRLYELNHKRMQMVVNELDKIALKPCPTCRCTGLLIGSDQLEFPTCYDCAADLRQSQTVQKGRSDAWDSVRPSSLSFPKRVEQGHESEDLPDLFPGLN